MRKRFQEQQYDHFAFVAGHLFHLRHNHARFRRERIDARAKRYRYILDCCE